ncbi:MAG: PfkB family carbohydrate kinase [Bryobacter sp.]|nr:PfkB family carbohydrate kinase [Bryobacter sp.]
MTPHDILSALPERNILVLGDICLDRWCTYDPATSEPSRETGLNRIGVVRVEATAGASGTIANNLADLGVGRVSLLGVIGEDTFGDELFACLAKRDIGVDLVVRSSSVQTFTYTKYINQDTGVEDLPRTDFINTKPLLPYLEAQLVHNLESFGHLFDAVLVCDQAETQAGGVVTPGVRAALGRLVEQHPEKVVWVDSRARAEHFRHVYLKPNEEEAKAASERLLGRLDFPALAEACELRALVVTEGERGASAYRDGRHEFAPGVVFAPAVDICGAGDSFSAGAASALACGAELMEALHFGNLVASITVTKKGTGTAYPEEVRLAARLATRLPDATSPNRP